MYKIKRLFSFLFESGYLAWIMKEYTEGILFKI